MGPQTSLAQNSRSVQSRAYLGEYYGPISGQRTTAERFFDPISNQISTKQVRRQIFPTHYAGIWSSNLPNSLGPVPRVGQCSAYSPELDALIIAYGSSSAGNYYNDAWVFTFSDLKWKCISQNLLSPRTGCRAVLVENIMYVFGGGKESHFYADLHAIDIFSGQFELIETTGPSPSPRTMPAFALRHNKIYVWGGYNGQTPSELSILDLGTLSWIQIELDVAGRPSPAYTIHGDYLYIFGSTRSQGLARLDLGILDSKNSEGTEISGPTFEFEPIDVLGEEPIITTLNASMINVGNFLITFGGTGNQQFTHVYAFDTSRNVWFIFYVQPDEGSLSISDGEITDQGLFVLPREHSYAACYRPNQRQIVSVCGSNERDPPPIFSISIGDALGILHLQDDLLAML